MSDVAQRHGENVDHFVISAATLAAVNTLVDELAARSSYTTLVVPIVDFPAWLAALGATGFRSHTSEMGGGRLYQRVQSEILHRDGASFSITSQGLPADWVTYPEPGAVNSYQFAAVAR